MIHTVKSSATLASQKSGSYGPKELEKQLRKYSTLHPEDKEKVSDMQRALLEEELVGNTSSNRNWRGILIALLVIAGLCSLILLAVVLVMPKSVAVIPKEPFTFNDVFDKSLQPRDFTPEWLTLNGQDVYVYRSYEDEILMHNIEENLTTPLTGNVSLGQRHHVEEHKVSADLQYVLLIQNVQKIFRHSFYAKYKIQKVDASVYSEPLIGFPYGDYWKNAKIQLVTWSPVGSSLVFVYENNLFYQASPTSDPVQLTTTGGDLLYNGVPDWIYEEEIFESGSALWISPDGRYVAYAEISDENVPVYDLKLYGPYEHLYGDTKHLRYPKAGDLRSHIIPKVHIKVIDLSDVQKEPITFSAPAILNVDHYLLQVAWVDPVRVYTTWSNRVQNRSISVVCSVKTRQCRENFLESRSDSWISARRPQFIDGEDFYLIVAPLTDTDGIWPHIARVSLEAEGQTRPIFLTSGPEEVREIVAVDTNNQWVYYTSTRGDSRQLHLQRIPYTSAGVPVLPECLSCYDDGEKEENDKKIDDTCRYVSASFSRSARYYVLGCLGPDIPTFTLRDALGEREDIVVENNTDVRLRYGYTDLPIVTYGDIKTDDGHVIHYNMYRPTSLNESHILQYATLVHTYNGPESQRVTYEFKTGFLAHLVSQMKFIYVIVDGRGTKGNGNQHVYQLYRKLGTIEVADQIAVIKHLTTSRDYGYMDKNRTAIWGWSYGGYVALHALADDPYAFQCAIAVAPVTDWRYYDAAYAERYMRFASPDDNYKGYDKANVSEKAENFNNKKILLVHGTADDNVHFQNSAQFMKALAAADVDYNTLIYPDKSHDISGPSLPRHLYRALVNFLRNQCWSGAHPRNIPPSELEKHQNKNKKDKN